MFIKIFRPISARNSQCLDYQCSLFTASESNFCTLAPMTSGDTEIKVSKVNELDKD
jgi:hypothetical protein